MKKTTVKTCMTPPPTLRVLIVMMAVPMAMIVAAAVVAAVARVTMTRSQRRMSERAVSAASQVAPKQHLTPPCLLAL